MAKRLGTFIAAWLLASAPWAVAQKPALKIATGELAPYATESRPDQGIALSIVRRSFELAGYQVEYTFLPWSRALAETRLGKWDASAYWGHKPEHEASFLLSDNVLTEQWVMVHRKAIALQWNALPDLKPYRMAMIQDYTYTPQIWAMANAGELKVERVQDDRAALKMLLLDRVDVSPMERNVACDLLQKNFTPAEASRLSAHPKLMTDSFTTHLLLPKARNESATRLAEFNAGLKKLRASGEYNKLLAQVNCPTAWSVTTK
ncbi:substrate-binding periplasmic protein [Rhodoferax aquaticus]|uniref:ABC transporter substrate-binding protein n=1 Tax=Rhodoferax aquaticus TaxID=2527691 RepID=A0A515ET74_9BURK|nr:ABC transporter substrate-binding protein [Rhodoferax aquaticus]QDL55828.1 ABC transporter substrate-binding protein [Rhodoferax aquaticus]